MIRSEEHTGDSGVAIVRHADDHRAAMTSTAAYLIQTGGAERDAVDWVPEFLRRARGTPVYAALRALGRDGVANLVDGCCARARQFATLLGAEPGVRILNDSVLNQLMVRFGDADALTRQVVPACRLMARAGPVARPGTDWRRCASQSATGRPAATTSRSVPTPCCGCTVSCMRRNPV